LTSDCRRMARCRRRRSPARSASAIRAADAGHKASIRLGAEERALYQAHFPAKSGAALAAD
jgi:hypothetical protein